MSTQTMTTPSSSDIRARIGQTDADLVVARAAKKRAEFRALAYIGFDAASHPNAGRFRDAPKELERLNAEISQLEDRAKGLTIVAEYAAYLEADEALKELGPQIAAAQERYAAFEFADCERLENRLAVDRLARNMGADSMRSIVVDDEMRQRLAEFHEERNRLGAIAAQIQALTNAKEHAIKVVSTLGDLETLLPTKGDSRAQI